MKITLARNLIQLRLSQLPEFVSIATNELGRTFDLGSHTDQSALLAYFADPHYGWGGAFRLWEDDMAETCDNQHYYRERIRQEFDHDWIFRPHFEADHQALLIYFEVEALVIPFERGALNLQSIFNQVKIWRDRIYCPPETT
jgi:hypothetical protein